MSQKHQINKAARLIRGIVLLVAITGIGMWAWKNFGTTPATASVQTEPSSSTQVNATDNPSGYAVVVTYFTSNARCTTCLKIEKQTHDTLEKNFAKELASKEMVFQTINFDKPENKHYIKDYDLAFKTVVVTEHKNGKEVQWAKYDKVWNLVDTPEQFSAYLKDGIRQHLSSEKK